MGQDKLQKSTTTDGEPPRPGYESGGAPAPINPRTGQHEAYWVLSEEERAKGFVRPLRRSYTHLRCRCSTNMGIALCETYARDPHYYGGTFCVNCSAHFPLRDYRPEARSIDGWAFLWNEDGEPVGSNVEESKEWRESQQKRDNEKIVGAGI